MPASLPNRDERDTRQSEPPIFDRRIPLLQSLLVRNSLFVAAVVILTAGLLGQLAYVTARDILHDNIHNRLRLIASERSARLEAYVRRQLERTELAAGRTRLVRLLQDYAEENIDAAALREEANQILRDAQQNSVGIHEIWIASPEGTAIAASDATHVGWTFADDPDFLAGQSQPHFGVPQQVDGQWLTYLTAPIRNNQNQLLGVVMVQHDATPLRDLLANRQGLEETGEILVGMRKNGDVHYLFSPPEEAGASVPLAEVPPLAHALAGQRGAVVTRFDGTEVLAAYQPIDYQPGSDRPWGLVATMNLAEAYAPVRQLRRTLITLQIGLVLLGVLASFLLARRITRPVLKLAGAARTIAHGDLEARVPVTSRDEIGLLGTAFNRMASQLAESREQLEERVEQRTAELSEAQMELRRQTRILQSVLDSMADGVIVADQDGKFLLWNPAAKSLIGIGPEEVAPQD